MELRFKNITTNRILKICMFSAFAGILSCLPAEGTSWRKIKGSGTLVSEERTLKDFTDIRVEAGCDVIITQDTHQKVTVKTDDNIMAELRTEVSGGKLRIFFSDRYNTYDPTSITIYISAALIEDLELAGSGTISSTNNLKCKNPDYRLTGSGKINVSVTAETVETSLSGSGKMELKGSASSAVHGISGSGNINALSLTCPDVKVKISGSGDCMVHAENTLDASITGSGHVEYEGAPQLTTHITGSGKVMRH